MNPATPTPPRKPNSNTRLFWIIAVSCLLVIILFVARPRSHQPAPLPSDAANNANSSPTLTVAPPPEHPHRVWAGVDLPQLPARSAEDIVAEKMGQFVRGRLELIEAMAKQGNFTLPGEVNRFFAAAQGGRWEETTNLFNTLKTMRESSDCDPGLAHLWTVINETYGVAQQAHDWPAQKLLDYGNAVLDALRPGMVYVGGTDAGRFIPTLLTDTGEGDPHIVLTQNALADGSYLDYLKFRYGDRLNALTSDDSQNSFQSYIADAQKRVLHDQQFPDEPKQVRPGEDIQISDNRVQVSGQVAVMLINERLLQTLLEKNPEISFALEESMPLKSLYPGATTLGPITELRATDTASALTPERAAQSLDYWRSTTETLLADAGPAATGGPRDAYAKLILGQANLFLDRNFPGEAEQAYQLATQLSPGQSDAVTAYANLLIGQKRNAEARQLAQTAATLVPDNKTIRALLERLKQMP